MLIGRIVDMCLIEYVNSIRETAPSICIPTNAIAHLVSLLQRLHRHRRYPNKQHLGGNHRSVEGINKVRYNG